MNVNLQRQRVKVSIQQLISNFQKMKLNKPNPPTEAAIKRAQFVDKTYVWKTK